MQEEGVVYWRWSGQLVPWKLPTSPGTYKIAVTGWGEGSSCGVHDQFSGVHIDGESCVSLAEVS